MTECYETTRSRSEASLMLIFPEGTWDILPFELRLLRPWYGSEVCGRTGITAHQYSVIVRWGYYLASAELLKPEKHSTDNEGDLLPPHPPELAQQDPSLKRRLAACHILIPVLREIASVPHCPDSRVQVVKR